MDRKTERIIRTGTKWTYDAIEKEYNDYLEKEIENMLTGAPEADIFLLKTEEKPVEQTKKRLNKKITTRRRKK